MISYKRIVETNQKVSTYLELDEPRFAKYWSIYINLLWSTDICGTEIKILENILEIFSPSMMTKVQINKISSHYRPRKRISLHFFGIPEWYGWLGNMFIIRYLISTMKCTHKLNSGFLTVGIISCRPDNGLSLIHISEPTRPY